MCCTLFFFTRDGSARNDPELYGIMISIGQGGLRSLSAFLETLIAVA